MQTEPIERKFVRPGLISEHLKCPICLDVFAEATRLFCGHTFCEGCLRDYMRGANTCPECRMRIDHKNIGIDLLAREIINEFEVFCPMDDCPWKGLLQELQKHCMVDCAYGEKANLKSKKNKGKKADKLVWTQIIDDQVRDKINQNIAKGSLEARVLAKTSSLNIGKDKQYQQQPQQEYKVNSQKTQTATKATKRTKPMQQQNKPRTSNYNFLESLFG